MTQDETPAAVTVLLAEHEICRRRLEATAAALERGVADAALAQAWALLRFLEVGLETHIAKEEGPLFPRLKAALPADDRLIDEMVAEHDLIRMKRDDVRAALLELSDAHNDLREAREVLRTALAPRAGAVWSLRTVKEATAVVAAKLEIHFQNEEELVFPLTPSLLAPAELDLIAQEMEVINDSNPSLGAL